jgi:Flp pilus assembly protein TadD
MMDASYYFERGNNHMNNGLFEEAMADYSKVIELQPDYAKAYTNRGICYNERASKSSC